jgi:hypothetical protein
VLKHSHDNHVPFEIHVNFRVDHGKVKNTWSQETIGHKGEQIKKPDMA